MKKIMFRQGDVLIEKIKNLPDNLQPIRRTEGKLILAHGEATGHHHAISDENCDLLSDESGVTYLDVKEAVAMLTHQEHSTIEIPAGNYRVIRQREYSPEAIRDVQD
jgi:hypothetical protein